MTGSDLNFWPKLPKWCGWAILLTFLLGVATLLTGLLVGVAWIAAHLKWV